MVEFLVQAGARIPDNGIKLPEDAIQPQTGAFNPSAHFQNFEQGQYQREENLARPYQAAIEKLVADNWKNLPDDRVRAVLETLGLGRPQ